MINAIRDNEPNNISTAQNNFNETAKKFFQQQHKYECTVCRESFHDEKCFEGAHVEPHSRKAI